MSYETPLESESFSRHLLPLPQGLPCQALDDDETGLPTGVRFLSRDLESPVGNVVIQNRLRKSNCKLLLNLCVIALSQFKTLIVKPQAGCQGRGIYLTKNIDKIDPLIPCVVQRYLKKPHLIDELKYDLRIYVLISSFDPLKIFMYHDGLVRLCTSPYEEPTNKNMKNNFCHLTNYAINKFNDKFLENE